MYKKVLRVEDALADAFNVQSSNNCCSAAILAYVRNFTKGKDRNAHRDTAGSRGRCGRHRQREARRVA
jgi:hypothetical protein